MVEKFNTAAAEERKLARSRAAERMRRSRKRRREGVRCFIVQVREREVEVLIQLGLLPPSEWTNRHSVIKALHAFFDETLSKVR